MGRLEMKVQEFYRAEESRNAEPLHYKVSGLDNIYLLNGFTVEVDEDGDRYTTITDMDGLHRAIALHIVLERKAPSGKELRFLREELHMSQAELAGLLGVSDQSVARWEKEQTEPHGAGVTALRMIYLLSTLPDDERQALLSSFVGHLRELAERDEEPQEDIVLSWNGDRWREPAMAA
jgi:DNA-binding transcriptional regulator YiaG